MARDGLNGDPSFPSRNRLNIAILLHRLHIIDQSIATRKPDGIMKL
ncbi:hypothetical protein PDTA9759_42870 [Phytobacter diazotrophicus]|uniref:Uncharacterized protein n=1 Tax=Phytobacter diazotrophicus TaxID=395631 RepID=A0ABM7VZX4_9ENTR|nr:hypothetical protein PDTA9734_42920 [Phytobacter diazotrophicus]BEG83733.1 hypothetical protein PDTA9730_41890 [Phytobacter diazotrophicus]BEG89631.1 hypothetical protein PDTA9759_42870 [Phytobacter diazotrophicus]BEG95395.1 hypothetical protein PDTA9832_42540 [Phytobacter diazotrophicus]